MYSVDCDYVGEVADVRAYVNKIIIVFKGKVIGEHERCFEKKKKIYDPWHYIPALERKPGALRNGAPQYFNHWWQWCGEEPFSDWTCLFSITK